MSVCTQFWLIIKTETTPLEALIGRGFFENLSIIKHRRSMTLDGCQLIRPVYRAFAFLEDRPRAPLARCAAGGGHTILKYNKLL